MKQIHSPKPWGCLVAAFASVLDLSYDAVVGYIGHDGSEVIWSTKPEPMNRRGFHPQELIRVAYMLGYSVTEIQRVMLSAPTPNDRIYTCENPYFQSALIQVGVIYGIGEKLRHAVASNGSEVWDPKGRIVPITELRSVIEPKGIFIVGS